ncbi:hypothetical protein L1987_33247 [Smallanthus sonchifolius]|uniref:Uncharacterized protein n=1 Tax=Smallanthus sonchifolius TaxID=185202 RepID=A0ACB9HT44_9ASTR|nr:hypothetical protein L1987_33247 [Smallanthus sonchifolius]
MLMVIDTIVLGHFCNRSAVDSFAVDNFFKLVLLKVCSPEIGAVIMSSFGLACCCSSFGHVNYADVPGVY